MSDKLDGFGPIYVLNLERSPERRARMIAEFEKHGITDFSFISAIDGTKDLESQGVVIKTNPSLVPAEHACTASHLLALEHWLSTNDSSYAILFEDDMSFELVEKWKVSWKELLNQIPEGYDILQMSPIRTYWEQEHSLLRLREVGADWGAGVYCIHREHAQHLVSQHIQNGLLKTFVKMDLSENILFNNAITYVYPLFTEIAQNESTMVGRNHDHIHRVNRDVILGFYSADQQL